jgi:hypothetical protein
MMDMQLLARALLSGCWFRLQFSLLDSYLYALCFACPLMIGLLPRSVRCPGA